MAKKSNSTAVGGPSASEQQKWQTEDDLRTLARAVEIRKDTARLKRAQALARQQMADLAKLASTAAKKD